MKPRIQWADGTPDEVKQRLLDELRMLADEHRLQTGEVVSVHNADSKHWGYNAQQIAHECGARWLVWVPNDELAGPQSCPLCEPEQINLVDLSPAQRTTLVRKLARTDAVDEMYVEIDKAQTEGRTHVSRWHHPDDLALIDELRKFRAQGFGELRDVRVELEGAWMTSRFDDAATRQKQSTITVVQQRGEVDHTITVRGVLVEESRSLVER